MLAPLNAEVGFARSFDGSGAAYEPTSLVSLSESMFQHFDNKLTLHSPIPKHPSPASSNHSELSSLSASLASSASSLPPSPPKSLTLEDEEIKRIFSNDRFDPNPVHREHFRWNMSGPSTWTEPLTPRALTDSLNPHARVFVPSLNPVPDELAALPSPFDLGPGAQSFLHPPPFRVPFTPPPVPQYPPGLPHPPHLTNVAVVPHGAGMHSSNGALVDYPPYVDLIKEALDANVSMMQRDFFANRIVTGGAWDPRCVAELAEIISYEACQACKDPGTIGQEVPVCPQERYRPRSSVTTSRTTSYTGGRAPAVALLAGNLRHHLSQWCGDDLACLFSDFLRVNILQMFMRHWDPSNSETAINYVPIPTAHCVRSALAISSAAAALYTQDFLSHADMCMCIDVFLHNLKSVEHAEALTNIVLGCGKRFWSSLLTMPQNPAEPIMPASFILKKHVGQILRCFDDNCKTYRLDDSKSVVGRPWGEGQLMARLHEAADSVKAWEGELQREMQEPRVVFTN